jgi:RNA polymerase sigma factor (sigma-70 family)
MERKIEQLACQAREGDGEALERLIMEVYGDVHGLSLRMLGFACDAEDAAQEILIKIITHLSAFRGDSTFKTWSFRIAINHLLSFRKTLAEKQGINFDLWEQLGDRIDPTFDHDSLPGTDKTLLAEEVRIGCMQGMLQCLDKKVRIAFILGELFEVTSEEGAVILGITPAAFRKRLSRGREQLTGFMRNNCGLVNSSNQCRCMNLIGPDIRDGWIDRGNLQFVGPRCRARIDVGVRDRLQELDEISRAIELFHSYPEYDGPPDTIVDLVKKMIDSREYKILS